MTRIAATAMVSARRPIAAETRKPWENPAASACAPKYLGLDAPRRHAPDREAIELFLETLTDEGRSAALSQEILTTAVEVHA